MKLPFQKKEPMNEVMKTIYKKDRFKRYCSLVIGILLISIAFNLFLLPNDIVFGGVSGF